MNHDTDLIICLISRIREKANRYLAAQLAARGMGGLKPIHGDVLWALFRTGQPTMKELAEMVDRKKSTVTTLVDKLVQLGYAGKTRDETDSRVFRISLTREGRALKDNLVEISDGLISTVYKDMPMAERHQLVKSLNTINKNW